MVPQRAWRVWGSRLRHCVYPNGTLVALLPPDPWSADIDPQRVQLYSSDAADVYFARTRRVLELQGLKPMVTMEIFANAAGVLCGIREAAQLLRHALAGGGEAWAAQEGESLRTKQVVLRITGPYLSFGAYETALLGMISHATGWCTAARAVVEAAEGVPVISFGARHVHPLISAAMEYAAIVGGCVTGATPAGAKLGSASPAGTMPHALVLIMGDTVEAALAFDRHMEALVPRIILVDTFRDEIEEALRVAEQMGSRLAGVRLDTPSERGGVSPELVHELRARLDQAGYNAVRIFVSGGMTVARIAEFRLAKAPVDTFGVGDAIATAPPIAFTADIKEVEGRAVAKRGRIPGRTDEPSLQRII